MGKERLDHLWKVLSSATNIKNLEYDEAVTIGSVFGEMRAEIERQQQEIKRLEEKNNVQFYANQNLRGLEKENKKKIARYEIALKEISEPDWEKCRNYITAFEMAKEIADKALGNKR